MAEDKQSIAQQKAQQKLYMSDYSPNDEIKIKTKSGDIFSLKKRVAEVSVTLKFVMEDMEGVEDITIPVNEISDPVIILVRQYSEHWLQENPGVDPGLVNIKGAQVLSDWDNKFLEQMDVPLLFEVIQAANFLENKPLLSITTQRVANLLKQKPSSEIKWWFDITADLTPEEEEEFKREMAN